MPNYYVNKEQQPNGDHEVHKDGCIYMPGHREYLGVFDFCWQAVIESQKYYKKTNGCKTCSKECHTT